MSDLDDSFAKLLGRQPSDAERQSLYRVRDALGLKNNDALWLVLMALQHYQGQYEKFPQAIAQAAKDTLVNFKVTADATVKASAEAAKADLAQAVAAAAQEVAHNTSAKQMWQWAAGCIAVAAFLCVGPVRLVHAQQLVAVRAIKPWIRHGIHRSQGRESSGSMGQHARRTKLAYPLRANWKPATIWQRCNGIGWKRRKRGVLSVQASNSDGNVYGWSAPMIDALNIATMPIADKVQRHMLASYYALQLDALQAEAKRLGYFFAQADTAATMPPVLAELLGAGDVIYRRESYLFPNCPESWERQQPTA
jgi:hypothetical protein